MQTTSMRGSVTRRSAMAAQCSSACSAPRARGAVAPAARKALSSVNNAAAARVVSAQAVAAAPAASATTSGARSAAKTDVPKEQQKPTAVITGASSGLGLAAAVALAKKGEKRRHASTRTKG